MDHPSPDTVRSGWRPVSGEALKEVMSTSRQSSPLGFNRMPAAFRRMSSTLDLSHGNRADKLAAMLRDNFRFFSQVPLKRLLLLCAEFHLLRVPKHEFLCLHGSTCEGVFVMLTGMAKLYSNNCEVSRGRTGEYHKPMSAATTHFHNQDFDNVEINSSVSLSVQRKSAGLHAEAELEMLGLRQAEITCGDVMFEREASYSLPYSVSIVAGENAFDVIFIDSPTYMQLAAPFPPQNMRDVIPVDISLESMPTCDRSPEQEMQIAESIQMVPGLEHLDLELAQNLAKHIRFERMSMETLVLQHGIKSNTVYLLIEGTVSIHDPPRSERRRGHGNAGNSSGLGACVRISTPGEEPFGLNSMILSCENLSTVACRSSCLFYTLTKADMSVDLYRNFESACSKIIRRPEYMEQLREDRKDHQILNIVNYLRENPFFHSLQAAAQQRLATTIELALLSEHDQITQMFQRGNASSTQLAVVNKGSVASWTPKSKKHTKAMSIRVLPLECHAGSGKTKNDSLDVVRTAAEDLAKDGGGTGRAGSAGFGQSSANLFSRAGSSTNVFSQRPSLLSRRPSLSRSKWGSVLSSIDHCEFLRSQSSEEHLEFENQLVASYGQGFWNGVMACYADQDNTEVFLVSKTEWRKIHNMVVTSDVSEVESFLANHSCFQGMKKHELDVVIQNTKLVHVNERAILFNSRDAVADLFFLKEGSIELRVDVSLERNSLSAAEKHVIPSIAVSSIGKNSIINDVIDLTSNTPVEVLHKWSSLPEKYTALAATKCTVVAISKVAVVMHFSAARRTHMLLTQQLAHSFHHLRCDDLAQARDGLLHGKTGDDFLVNYISLVLYT